MNIISDPWLPVRRYSGKLDTIRPADIADRNDPAVALMWPRPDFNLSCLELLIGLVYAGLPPEDDDEYMDTVDEDRHKRLVDRLGKLEPWFNLDGDGPRFMQDLEPLEGAAIGVDMLLLDSAGANAASKNADMMVRRNRFEQLGRSAAAMALYTLQNFAPSGGAGNRTSMRGGGPLVTLVEPRKDATLWQIVYANTPCGQPVIESNISQAFPWLIPTVDSKLKGSEVHAPASPDGAPPYSAFFGMPRRLRLVFDQKPGVCPMMRSTDTALVTGVIQKPYGNNYGVWRHPCSPYYRTKVGEVSLPVHPKPGRLGYRQFVGVSLQGVDNELRDLAFCVRRYKQARNTRKESLLRLIVGGWAMDNMKPVDYVEGLAPLPVDTNASLIDATAVDLVKAADIVAGQLVGCLKRALLIDVSDKGLVADAKAEFYDRTEADFYRALNGLLNDPSGLIIKEQWRQVLSKWAMSLFDRFAIDGLADRKPERAENIIDARKSLKFTLSGYGKNGTKLFNHLNLQLPEVSVKRGKKLKTEKPV